MRALRNLFALIGWLLVIVAAFAVPVALATLDVMLPALPLLGALNCGLGYALCDIAVNIRLMTPEGRKDEEDRKARTQVQPTRVDDADSETITVEQAMENMRRNRAAAKTYHDATKAKRPLR